jgi:hypothetical protein
MPLPVMAFPDHAGSGYHWDAATRVLTVSHATDPVEIGFVPSAAKPASGPPGLSVTAAATGAGAGLRLTVRDAGAAQVDVFDVRGRRVRRLVDGALLPRGVTDLSWDGRDAGGSRVASGSYLVRCHVGLRTATTRVTIAR